MNKHQRIWIKHYGEIPFDKNGRKFEIHHIDGNHENNNITNLKLVTIDEHFNIHHQQGDWGACTLIAKRMNLPVDFVSKIQTGKKRPGIGGAPKGRIPWNKGITGYKLKCNRKGKRFSSKLKKEQVLEIREFFEKVDLQDLYQESLICRKGGPRQSYSWFIAKYLATTKYKNLTTNAIHHILKGKTWANV